MKQSYNTLLLLLLLPAIVFAGNPKFRGKYTKTKTINKEFTVNSTAGLKVNNSYGNIDVVTWNENRTVIEVVITTNGNNEESVQKKLDQIKVEFSGNATLVTAKTVFNDGNGSWSWWGKKNNNVKMEINYTIKLPINNTVDLTNDYGTISINEINGNAKINCDYGQVNLGSLNAENNYLNFDYSKNSSIAYMRSGKINADYSSFILEKTEKLELNADYTRSEVLEVNDLSYNNDYGKLIVGTVKKVFGRGDYIPLRVATLTGELNVNTDYGSISVDRITNTGGDITIRSDYAGIKLGYDSGYNFNFIVDLSYAGLSGKEDLEITNESKDYSSKTYSGYHGSRDSKNTININSNYGGVNLYKN